MPERSPHVLTITTVGCLFVVGLLAVGVLTNSIIVVGLAFVATLVAAALLITMVVCAMNSPAPGGRAGGRRDTSPQREATVR
jgi:heme A synthase